MSAPFPLATDGDFWSQFLTYDDVVENSEAILQVFEAIVEAGQTRLHLATRKQAVEKVSGIAQLLDRDSQFVALVRVKFFKLIRLFHRLLATSREDILGKLLNARMALSLIHI